MSSLLSALAPVSVGENGAPQVRSLAVVWATITFLACVQVAQIFPVESLSMTSVSVATVVIVAGKPASRLYVFDPLS